jgi:hypothetical protein
VQRTKIIGKLFLTRFLLKRIRGESATTHTANVELCGRELEQRIEPRIIEKKTLFTSWWITVQPSATIQRTVPFLPKFWCMYTSLNLRHKTSNKRYVTQRTNIDQTFIQRWGMHISRSEHNGAPVMTLRVNSSADGTLLGSLGNSCIKYNRVNSKRTPWYSPVPCTWAISCNICCYSNPHQQIKS